MKNNRSFLSWNLKKLKNKLKYDFIFFYNIKVDLTVLNRIYETIERVNFFWKWKINLLPKSK